MKRLDRRTWLRGATGAAVGMSLAGELRLAAQDQAEAEREYRTPYELKFRHELRELEEGWGERPWSSPEEESLVPHDEWYGPRVKREWGAWGPPARQYPAPAGLERRPVAWLQDRVILAARRHLGLPYQHHHIPAWDPPADWPWHKVAFGRNSRGIDCSNFSSFYFNYALGIKLDTGIVQQAERTEIRAPGGRGTMRVQRIEKRPYDELIRVLRPADLLYIRNDAGKLAHVILWLGEVGVSPDGLPLVLDSTGTGHVDANETKIPVGVHIRPFGPKSWYAYDFAHAHRIIESVDEVREGEAPEVAEGGELLEE